MVKKVVMAVFFAILLSVFIAFNYLIIQKENADRDTYDLIDDNTAKAATISVQLKQIDDMDRNIMELTEKLTTLREQEAGTNEYVANLEKAGQERDEALSRRDDLINKLKQGLDVELVGQQAREWIEFINNGDYEKAYARYSKAVDSAYTSMVLSEFRAYYTKHVGMIEIKSLDVMTRGIPESVENDLVIAAVVDIVTPRALELFFDALDDRRAVALAEAEAEREALAARLAAEAKAAAEVAAAAAEAQKAADEEAEELARQNGAGDTDGGENDNANVAGGGADSGAANGDEGGENGAGGDANGDGAVSGTESGEAGGTNGEADGDNKNAGVGYNDATSTAGTPEKAAGADGAADGADTPPPGGAAADGEKGAGETNGGNGASANSENVDDGAAGGNADKNVAVSSAENGGKADGNADNNATAGNAEKDVTAGGAENAVPAEQEEEAFDPFDKALYQNAGSVLAAMNEYEVVYTDDMDESVFKTGENQFFFLLDYKKEANDWVIVKIVQKL